MIKKIFILLMCFATAIGVAHAQGLSDDTQENQIFWTQEVDSNQPWGLWLKEVYRPYSDELLRAILKIVSSTIDIDSTGKSNEELLEEVNAAYNRSLKSMEEIRTPAELKVYHSKIVELYKQTINADPDKASENALVIKQLTREADQEITKVFKLHGVSQKIIDRVTRE